MDARRVDNGEALTARGRGRRRAGEEKEHVSVVEKVAGARDGELGWASELEADGLALPRWGAGRDARAECRRRDPRSPPRRR